MEAGQGGGGRRATRTAAGLEPADLALVHGVVQQNGRLAAVLVLEHRLHRLRRRTVPTALDFAV
jgi:hypothetical protein